MGKTTFASLIITKLRAAVGTDGATYTVITPEAAQRAIADAITEYLIANTTISISYAGTLNTGSGVDSITTDTMKINGKCDTIGKPSDFVSWVNKIQAVIASSFSVASPGIGGVATTFKPFNPTAGALTVTLSDLNSAYKNNPSDPTQVVWEAVCEKILSWLNSEVGKNPTATAVTATRAGVSTGTASLVKITIT